MIKDPSQPVFTDQQAKNYYISPFIDYDSTLKWTFTTPGENLQMLVDSVKNGEPILKTSLTAAAAP